MQNNMLLNQPQFSFDLIGIGIGPFNLGLAALVHTIPNVRACFFDQNEKFAWHPGLLIDHAQLQVPFIADLVTFASPTHPFSFLNYLHHHQRLYKFYFREKFHVSRQEYNHYCQWVCDQLSNLTFNYRVKKVEHYQKKKNSLLYVRVENMRNHQEKCFYTKHLAIGTGTGPYVPKTLQTMNSRYIRHSAHFLEYKIEFSHENTICVIGSGQSAAEIILELLREYHHCPHQIIWATRSRGFFPMEYSKLGLEHFSPDYINYFYSLDQKTKYDTVHHQHLMYKGISQTTIAEIYDMLYQLTVANKTQPLQMLSHSDCQSIKKGTTSRFTLQFNQWQTKSLFDIDCDAVICATGYQPKNIDFLNDLSHELIADDNQPFALNNDFSLCTTPSLKNKIYMQNNSLFSHGVGSPDLGLICYRNSLILNQICKKEIYPIHTKNIFQDFTCDAKEGIVYDTHPSRSYFSEKFS